MGFDPARERLYELTIYHIIRRARNILLRKVPGFKSAGHALLVAAYVALNAAVSLTNFTKLEFSMGNLGSRFGWYVASFRALRSVFALAVSDISLFVQDGARKPGVCRILGAEEHPPGLLDGILV